MKEKGAVSSPRYRRFQQCWSSLGACLCSSSTYIHTGCTNERPISILFMVLLRTLLSRAGTEPSRVCTGTNLFHDRLYQTIFLPVEIGRVSRTWMWRAVEHAARALYSRRRRVGAAPSLRIHPCCSPFFSTLAQAFWCPWFERFDLHAFLPE